MSTLIQELDQPDLLSDNHRRSYAFGLVPPPKSSAPGIAPEDVTLRNITPGVLIAAQDAINAALKVLSAAVNKAVGIAIL
jgi:hypothetical protein